jgi:phytoene dehydrogenase-like protein
MKTVVIGSGLAGLTAALTLARAGHEVEIFEQSDKPGGVTQGFEKDGFRWDFGQLNVEGFGRQETSGEILHELGIREQLNFIPEDREYSFPDFRLRVPETYQGPRWRIDELKRLFPEESDGLERYYRDLIRFTRLVTRAKKMETGGLGTKISFYLALLPLLPKLKWSADKLMAHYFKSEKLRAVFISILADFFTPPSQFQGLGVFALNAEISYDKRMPELLAKDAVMTRLYTIEGGTRRLIEVYVRALESLGVKLHTSTPIQKIVLEGGRVSGVQDARGEFHPCQRVIASGGAKELFFNLVGREHLDADFARKLEDIPLMDSVFMLHLGVDYDPGKYLRSACTYFYGTYDVEGEVKRAGRGIYHEGAAGFVVHWPSLRSPKMAPAGKHALTLYTICPEKLAEGDWQQDREKYAASLLAYTEKYLPGLSKHILTRAVFTPLEFRQLTHLQHHAFGGIAPLMDSWRVPHKTPIKGLWFIGAQSASGGGVNNVLPAAYKVAKELMREGH